MLNFGQIHWEQQKNGFYLFFILEVISSFQINIIPKKQQCCKFIFFIAIIHDTQIMHSLDKNKNFHICTHKIKYLGQMLFFFLQVYFTYTYQTVRLKNAKKQIHCHINKLTTGVYVRPLPLIPFHKKNIIIRQIKIFKEYFYSHIYSVCYYTSNKRIKTPKKDTLPNL